MKHNIIAVLMAVALSMTAAGCAAVSPELIEALAKDEASACFVADVRGGAGAVVGSMSGGYGQSSVRFCRSNKDQATVTMTAEGQITIQNGVAQ